MPSPAIDRYEDFDLRIEKASDGRYRVRVSDLNFSDLGEAGSEFAAPFAPRELETLLAGVKVRGRDLPPIPLVPRQQLEEIGGRLFQAVFSGQVYEFWRASLSQARREDFGLRVRLRLRAPDLVRWPWEYLFDPDEGFLALSPRTPIVRYLELPAKGRPLGVEPPIRILVAIASPAGHVELDAEREWRGLKEALAGLEQSGQVVLDRLEGASLSALQQKIREPFHVFHFIGHGTFETEQDEGVLLFEEEGGKAERVIGKRLATVLRNQSSLGLVVLNACHGAMASPTDAFGGVAQSLIWGKVPVVIAMRSIVSDRAAVVFAHSFYQALARRLPVEEALCEARQALFAVSTDPEWGIPVLYMRSPDGHLFERKESRRWLVAAGLASLLLGALGTGGYFFSRARQNGPAAPRFIDANPRGSSEGCPPIEELGIVFKRIDPGKFTMGARGEGKDAKPHDVILTKPFCMSEHEITQEQWEKIMGENPSEHRGDGRRPVERVSWKDVQDFLRKLRSLAPKAGLRLPTEAQWEYAARGKSRHLFSFGDDPNRLPAYGNCESRSHDDRYDTTALVGSFIPNEWGLYDMHGNISEWVADWYGPYDLALQKDPAGPLSGTLKVRRGGSFEIKPENCGSARRNRMKSDDKRRDVGFRILRDVEK